MSQEENQKQITLSEKIQASHQEEKEEEEEVEEVEVQGGKEPQKSQEGEAEEIEEEEMTDQHRTQRVNDLVTAITEFSFYYVRRGLFESHKLIFATLLTFRIL